MRLPNLEFEFYNFGVFSNNSGSWPNGQERGDWQKDKFQMNPFEVNVLVKLEDLIDEIVVKASEEADV